ncbi:MAG: ATP phosphoribosyltransferase regulatory subunit [Chloroflexi bacterium]|nr:ATP phosphoribosyltransferase regulatory subunit [Chloroflexota bacterium]
MSFSLDGFKSHLAAAGYVQRDTPLLERSDLYSTKGGDRVISRLLTLNHHGAEYALRPEFTASAVRGYGAAPEAVVRWQFSGPVFSDLFATAERPFQRESVGAELIGFEGPGADSEIIGLAASGLLVQGNSDFTIVVGHAGLSRVLIERYTTDPELVQFLLDQCDTLRLEGGLREAASRVDEYLAVRSREADGMDSPLEYVDERSTDTFIAGRRRRDIQGRLAEKRRRAASAGAVKEALEFLADWVSIRSQAPAALARIYQLGEDNPAVAGIAADLRTTLDLLDVYGVPSDAILLQPHLNRIWEYYSGIVFEFQTADGVSLGGGGRYDGLVRLLGGRASPAVGFQLNVDALAASFGALAPHATSVRVQGPRAAAPSVVWWACALRARGITAILDEYPSDVSIEVERTVSIDPGTGDAVYADFSFTRADVENLCATILGYKTHE